MKKVYFSLLLILGLFFNSSYGQNPTVSISSIPTIEGTNIVFTVSLSETSNIETNIQVIGGLTSSIDGPDYNLYTTHVSIPIGQTSTVFEVETIDNAIGEPTENFEICLLVDSGNTSNQQLCSTFTILDNDPNVIGTIIANDENVTYNAGIVSTFFSVLDNDTINEIPATTNSVVLTPLTVPDGFILLPDGKFNLQGFQPSGIYTITYKICAVSDLNNCSTATVTFIILDSFLASSNFTFKNFSFSPNPVTNVLKVINDSAIDSIEVSSLLGQKIMNKSVNDLQTEIDMSQLTKGIYFVKVTANGSEKIVKVIKE
jgi:Secretion system C-terminal sorting domain